MANQLGQVNVFPGAANTVKVENTDNIVAVTSTETKVTVTTEGPRQIVSGPLEGLSNVVTSGKVDKSVLYYDVTSDKYKVDATATFLTLTDGGNF